MHEERDTLWHFVMSIVKYHESHYVAVLDRYDLGSLKNLQVPIYSKLHKKNHVISY